MTRKLSELSKKELEYIFDNNEDIKCYLIEEVFYEYQAEIENVAKQIFIVDPEPWYLKALAANLNLKEEIGL